MKARVKATGEIINVKIFDKYFDYNGRQCIIYEDEKSRTFNEKYLDFNLENSPEDYWDRLLHQYAGMAMSRLVELVNHGYEYVCEEVAILAANYATALVEKLKENKL